jgi:hypothetical protein
MQEVVDKKSIYFHCKIGTDRTGTLAYFLEGLLGVSDEERLQDFELSYFSGLLTRHRFYSLQPGSSVSETHRFTYMQGNYPTNASIYDFYTENGSNSTAVNLVEQFRREMIE